MMKGLFATMSITCMIAASAAQGAQGAAAPSASDANPLLLPWTGPYGGVPPFDRAGPQHLRPALEFAMAEQLAEVDRIANDPAPPTFQNTIEAMERSGRTLDRVQAVFNVHTSTLNDAPVQSIEREMSPRMAAFRDRILQNEKLFGRIAAVYEARERSGLTPEQQRLAWLYYTNFVRAGARLDAASKQKLSDLNQRLAKLFTTFSQNVLADENERYTLIERREDLAGLPESLVAGAAAAAAERGHEGKWVILNTRSSVEPFLEYSSRRDLRERVWREFVSRGDNGGPTDNDAIITQILQLRAERAQLLGYDTHAHWRLENSMAGTPERAMELMEAVWPAAVARVREEVADMQAIADQEAAAGQGPKIRIEPWDYRYYAEKVRKARYELDANEVKPYLQLEKLREGMFFVAERLFGMRFVPLEPGKVPVYHPDVRVWEVRDLEGRHVGLFYFDPYARPNKRSGAWMNAYRRQESFERPITTIVSNNSNFVKAAPGEAVLISWDDARTLFHEFGHALHGLSSQVRYPALSGTLVPRDYVEFPSQLLENWLATPEVLNRFALHHRTGRPIPQELVARIERSETFNEGFRTVEYLSGALVDMKMHLAGGKPIDPRAFERQTLEALGMPREIVMRHRPQHFLHIFSGDSYSAGYYSYLWSDTLAADAWEAFLEGGGPWDAKLARRMQAHVFSTGNTLDPAEAYRQFRGRDPGIGALMRKRGFPAPGERTAAAESGERAAPGGTPR